ncbi:hypothetical protein [Actinomadura sp. NPDC048394]|jgi:hypothetical protein|uniref:hypothetical protein n=1 Tax=Actinomadura sp. NPDC048394 TaxID=3158223 RepID=UPI0033F542E1
MKTSLWVKGFKVVKTDKVSAGQQTVQAVATPVSVIWNLGEATKTCGGGGGAVAAGENAGDGYVKTCDYIYQRSSASQPGGSYHITATISWSVRWTCEGADCQGNEGDLPQQQHASEPTPLIVDEIQTTTSQ